MALQAGSAFLDIIPKLASGFGKKLTSDVEPEVERAGDSAGSAFSAKFAAAGVAGAAALGMGFASALSMEAGTDKLAAQLGLTEGIADMAGKAASNLYKGAWGDSMEDVNAAIGAVGTSLVDLNKVSQGELEATTAKALDLATAFDMDVSEAVQSAGVLMKSGLAADSNEAFDLMAAGLQKVPAALRGDLMEAMDEYGTYLERLGFSGGTAMTMLVDGAKGGAIQLDKTGDALKEFSILATDMSTSSVDAYKAIGLNAQQMANDILAGGDRAQAATMKVANGLAAIKDPATQANTAIALFGTPLEDLGVAKIPAFLDSLLNSQEALGQVEGSAERLGATLNNNAATNIEAFKRQALQGMTELIGGSVIPKVEELSTKVVNLLGGNTETAKKIVVGAVGAIALAVTIHAATIVAGWVASGTAATVNAIKIVAGWVATAAAAVASGATTVAIYALYAAGWVSTGASALVGAARVVAGWVMTGTAAIAAGIVMVAQVALHVAQWVFLGAQSLIQAGRVAAAWLIAMGPIGLVIAAVIGLVVLIVANWDTIKRITSDLWETVKRWTGAAWDWIKDAVKRGIDFLVHLFLNFTGPGLIIKHWDAIKSATGAAWDWVTDKISDFVNFFTGIPRRLASAGSGMFDFMKDSFRNGINFIIDKWNSLSFSIPSVDVPGLGKVGGGSLSTPDIPRFAKGGVGRGVFLAGENGAELINTGTTSARILDHSDTLEAIAGTGRRQVTEKHYHYHNEAELRDPLADQFREMERLQLPL